MAQRHAIVAGASGFIGRALVTELVQSGWTVTRLVRRDAAGADEVSWDPQSGTLDAAALSGADAVINLSGASISRIPWTRSVRASIVSSRHERHALLRVQHAGAPARSRARDAQYGGTLGRRSSQEMARSAHHAASSRPYRRLGKASRRSATHPA